MRNVLRSSGVAWLGWSVVALLALVVPLLVTGKVTFDKDGKVSLLEAMQHLTGWDTSTGNNNNHNHEEVLEASVPQPMMVIGAGQGRTGTTSLIQALSKMGLESYHMTKIFETTGHMDMWHDYYVKKTLTIDQLIDRIANDGFNATMDVPMNFYYPRLTERYPDALVILTLRKDGAKGWVKSLYESVFLLQPILRRPPLSWFPRAKTQREFFEGINRDLNVPLDDETGLPKREDLVMEYDRWARHVQQTVPPDKLLVFYAQDGWKPLCDFLAPLSPVVERNCQTILASGEPYPHANEKVFMQRLAYGTNRLCDVCQMVPVLAIFFLVVRLVRSRSKTAKVKGL